ncbi:MAG TPA: conjugal transfer protein [Solirubrobacteraceae bacterium]|nr:conjugal transfer protein [Solirubrobacteraceae bacterium]
MRLIRRAPRCLFYTVCIAGLFGSVRFAIAPPRPAARPADVRPLAPDLAARGYATLFARRYLTWEAARPMASESALASMTGPAFDADAGLTLPPSGEQSVIWAEVVQERALAPTRHVYTVAAQTDTAGLVYLTVPVARERGGQLALAGYPAFVGAPAAAAGQLPAEAAEVDEPALTRVVERALRNYLAASTEELSADLVDGARVTVPTASLRLLSMPRLDWSSDRRSVLAVLRAQDARGAQYTLGYEADVEQVDGRWELSAIQVDPNE